MKPVEAPPAKPVEALTAPATMKTKFKSRLMQRTTTRVMPRHPNRWLFMACEGGRRKWKVKVERAGESESESERGKRGAPHSPLSLSLSLQWHRTPPFHSHFNASAPAAP